MSNIVTLNDGDLMLARQIALMRTGLNRANEVKANQFGDSNSWENEILGVLGVLEWPGSCKWRLQEEARAKLQVLQTLRTSPTGSGRPPTQPNHQSGCVGSCRRLRRSCWRSRSACDGGILSLFLWRIHEASL